MSQHDLVSAQTSNVCITCHAALNAITYIICVKQFVMLLPLNAQMLRTPMVTSSNFLGFNVSRKGGIGGGGLVYTPKG